MKKIYAVLAGATLLSAPLASAQDVSFNLRDHGNRINTTAGFHIVMPFGGKHAKRVQDRARFGLMLNMEREYTGRNFLTPKRVNTNLMDFGWQFDGHPTMLMGGEDIYTPLFTPLSADEGSVAGISKNTVLLVAGGVLAAGAVVALAGGNGNDNDNDGPDDDNDGDDG